MRVYVIATRPFSEKVMDNKFFFTSKDADHFRVAMLCDDIEMLKLYNVYAADIEIHDKMPKQKENVEFSQLVEAAKNVINWYYIFGENSSAPRAHLQNLAIALRKCEDQTKI